VPGVTENNTHILILKLIGYLNDIYKYKNIEMLCIAAAVFNIVEFQCT